MKVKSRCPGKMTRGPQPNIACQWGVITLSPQVKDIAETLYSVGPSSSGTRQGYIFPAPKILCKIDIIRIKIILLAIFS